MVYIQRIRWESVRVGINNGVYTKNQVGICKGWDK